MWLIKYCPKEPWSFLKTLVPRTMRVYTRSIPVIKEPRRNTVWADYLWTGYPLWVYNPFMDNPLQRNLVEDLCATLRGGTPLFMALKSLGISHRDYKEIAKTHGADIAEAEELGADALAERLLTIHEELPTAVAKVASDNAKWFLSKRARKTYGDKIDINQNTNINIVNAFEFAQERARNHLLSLTHEDDGNILDHDEIPTKQPDPLPINPEDV